MEPKKTADPMKELFWFATIMIGFAALWLMGGGPTKEESTKPYIKPPAPLDSGQTYGVDPFGNKINASAKIIIGKPATPAGPAGQNSQSPNIGAGSGATPENPAPIGDASSPYKGKIFIETVSRGYNSDPANEYVRLRVDYSAKDKIKLTGMVLKSAVTGKSAVIGNGVNVPYPGVVNVSDPIFVSAGDVIYAATGRSPNGLSFKINKCTGYFEQNQDFAPSLPINCPRISDEPSPQVPNALDDKCLDYIDTIYSCQTQTTLPVNLSNDCQSFISKRTNYNWCLDAHRNDKNFFGQEWRIYLNQGSSLWKSQRETVELLDQNGKSVDKSTY